MGKFDEFPFEGILFTDCGAKLQFVME
jgi:hypothetical protein